MRFRALRASSPAGGSFGANKYEMARRSQDCIRKQPSLSLLKALGKPLEDWTPPTEITRGNGGARVSGLLLVGNAAEPQKCTCMSKKLIDFDRLSYHRVRTKDDPFAG